MMMIILSNFPRWLFSFRPVWFPYIVCVWSRLHLRLFDDVGVVVVVGNHPSVRMARSLPSVIIITDTEPGPATTQLKRFFGLPKNYFRRERKNFELRLVGRAQTGKTRLESRTLFSLYFFFTGYEETHRHPRRRPNIQVNWLDANSVPCWLSDFLFFLNIFIPLSIVFIASRPIGSSFDLLGHPSAVMWYHLAGDLIFNFLYWWIECLRWGLVIF